MSRVDVVVPCYNYAHFLPRCVDSVLSQDGVEVRVLIIDDCSSDDSAEVGTALAAADSRVECRRHEVNQGHIATYNEGLLEWAGGDYTALLSADDLLVPGSLGRAARIMDDDPSVGMVYGRSVYFQDEEDLPRITTRQRGVTTWRGADWIEGRCRDGHNVISSPEVVVRTEVQHRVGGYRPDLPHAGDLEMWLRIAAVAGVAYVRGVPQAYYRVHAASMQRSQFNSGLIDLQQRRDVFEAFLEAHATDLVDPVHLKNLVGTCLAREALWAACRSYDRDDVESVPVDELVEFALGVLPAAHRLREYSALRRRQRLGATVCHRTQVFAVSAAAHRARNWWWWQSWKRRGV